MGRIETNCSAGKKNSLTACVQSKFHVHIWLFVQIIINIIFFVSYDACAQWCPPFVGVQARLFMPTLRLGHQTDPAETWKIFAF